MSGPRRSKWPLWIVAGLFVAFALGPLVGPGPYPTDVTARYEPPSWEHPLGTDHLGRDVLSRVLTAGTLNVSLALACALIALTTGSLLGAVCGYIGGVLDRLLMRLLDVWQSVPSILLGLLVVSLFGKSIVALLCVISLSFVPMYARMVRAEVLPQRHAVLVEAARLAGVAEWRILLVYLLPQHLTAAIAYLPIQAAYAVGMTAGLGFIGLGVKPPTPEWGAMISEGTSDLFFMGMWWTTLPAGLLLGVTSLLLFRGGDWLAARLHAGRPERPAPRRGATGPDGGPGAGPGQGADDEPARLPA